ncbi:TlpA disulfide reductase family protein [Cecembia sp.]|uniref:TlpA family protein disulfide reductase n=2 Tax=Cecembia sp. TaxID=1898110 RepID=UPI0025BD5655|nr:TlpA disulfide reductase family protein [Cecembia sp.]
MKHLSVFPLFLLLFVFSCGPKQVVDSTIIIAGQFFNSESKEVEIYMGNDSEFFPLAEDGHFLIGLEIDDYRTFQLGTDRRSFELFMVPGDSIYVTADAKDFRNSFQASGDRIAENTYLVEKTRSYFESNMMDLFEKDKDEYFEVKNGFFADQRKHFDQLKQAQEIHPGFLKLEEAYFEYTPLSFDIYYLNSQAFFKNLTKEELDFPMEELKAKLAEIDLGRSDLLIEGSYTAIISHLLGEKTKEISNHDTTLQNTPEGNERAAFLAMEELLENPAVKDFFLFRHLMENLQFKGLEAAKPSIEKFQAENQSPKLVSKLEKELKKWDAIMPGMEIPDFSFEDISGEMVQLSNLKGTLVYIDIWATWCKPCIEEHPYWDQLKADYEDQPVSFLTISIDENKEAWEKMVISKNMEGLQWIAEKAWRSDLNLHFMVNSIPRFILLDGEGKIIDPNAERPSGDIWKTLDQFL